MWGAAVEDCGGPGEPPGFLPCLGSSPSSWALVAVGWKHLAMGAGTRTGGEQSTPKLFCSVSGFSFDCQFSQRLQTDPSFLVSASLMVIGELWFLLELRFLPGVLPKISFLAVSLFSKGLSVYWISPYS